MYKEAEKVLREAIKQLPNNPLLYYSLGVLLGRINRLQVHFDSILVCYFTNNITGSSRTVKYSRLLESIIS